MRAVLLCCAFLGCHRAEPPPVEPETPPPARESPPPHAVRSAEDESAREAADPEPTDEAEPLFARGDQLAEQGRFDEALDAWRRATLHQLPLLRRLQFRYDVVPAFMDREALRRKIVEELKKEQSDAQAQADEVALRAFGFVEPGFGLRKTMESMLTEEIAGFYDPDEKRLFLIDQAPDPKGPKSLLDMLTGSGGFDADAQKAVLSHEMAHALDDQHFDLLSLQRSLKADEDASLALTALVEGEAMVTMMLTVAGPEGAADLLELPPGVLGAIMDIVLPLATAFATGETFKTAPLVLRETLLVPYTKGLTYCLTLHQRGGWKRIDEAFRSPPISTEQVLHPEREDAPTAFTFEGPAPLDASWTLVKENVLGELLTELLLRPRLGDEASHRAAEGWDGDRYRVYRRGDDTRILWATTWDTDADAGEFAAAAWPGSAIQRRGRDVFVVRGAPDAVVGALLAWLGDAKMGVKTMPLKTFPSKAPFPPALKPRL